MKNLFLGSVATLVTVLGFAAPSFAGDFYAVVENDLTAVNQGVEDFATSTAGIGYSTQLGRAIVYAEVGGGVTYTADDVMGAVKSEAGVRGLITDGMSIEASVENTWLPEINGSITEVQSKLRIKL